MKMVLDIGGKGGDVEKMLCYNNDVIQGIIIYGMCNLIDRVCSLGSVFSLDNICWQIFFEMMCWCYKIL